VYRSKEGVALVGEVALLNRLAGEEPVSLAEDRMKELVRDLHRANPIIYWIDLLLSATFGWASFTVAVVLRPFSWPTVIAATIAGLLLYRALCFMHELSHQHRGTLPKFESIWNLLVGYPLLMPSFVYIGVHNDHHKTSTYGTSEDPEYLPFARSSRMTIVFALESVLIPAILLIRFLILAPIGFISRRFEKWLVVHASSLTMNIQYRRVVSANLLNRVRFHSAGILLLWTIVMGLILGGLLPWRVLAIWFTVCAAASFVNTLRTLGAHAYESSGEPLDRTGQLHDSIDTPGHFWTELWAPVGLRYHALHHYFPGIPYHHLPEAYRRFVSTLPISDTYRRMSSPSLPHSLRSLYRKGLRPSKQ
jgi:fatty acid desaturase